MLIFNFVFTFGAFLDEFYQVTILRSSSISPSRTTFVLYVLCFDYCRQMIYISLLYSCVCVCLLCEHLLCESTISQWGLHEKMWIGDVIPSGNRLQVLFIVTPQFHVQVWTYARKTSSNSLHTVDHLKFALATSFISLLHTTLMLYAFLFRCS